MMTTTPERNTEEMAILADMVCSPNATAKYARQFLVTADSFSDYDCGVVWRDLIATKSTDSVKLMSVAAKRLGLAKTSAKNAFLDLVSVHEGRFRFASMTWR